MGMAYPSFHVWKLKIKLRNVAVLKKNKEKKKLYKIQSTHLQWNWIRRKKKSLKTKIYITNLLQEDTMLEADSFSVSPTASYFSVTHTVVSAAGQHMQQLAFRGHTEWKEQLYTLGYQWAKEDALTN